MASPMMCALECQNTAFPAEYNLLLKYALDTCVLYYKNKLLDILTYVIYIKHDFFTFRPSTIMFSTFFWHTYPSFFHQKNCSDFAPSAWRRTEESAVMFLQLMTYDMGKTCESTPHRRIIADACHG